MVTIPILLYHSVAPGSSAAYQRWCMPPALFDEHLAALTELGYSCLTVSDLIAHRDAATMPANPLAITFDDGRADFIEHATPLLAARALPATIYVVSNHVGGTSSFLPIPEEHAQPMMGWNDLRQLPAAGIEVGAHSCTHPELDLIGSRRAGEEIHRSKEQLEDGMAGAVRSFAYPHGYHSRSIIRHVRDAGYTSACAVRDRWSHEADDRFALSRLIVGGHTSVDELVHRLTQAERPTRRSNVLRVGWRAARWARKQIGTRRP